MAMFERRPSARLRPSAGARAEKRLPQAHQARSPRRLLAGRRRRRRLSVVPRARTLGPRTPERGAAVLRARDSGAGGTLTAASACVMIAVAATVGARLAP